METMKTAAKSLLIIALMLGACTPLANESEQARQTLSDFFDSLNQGSYIQADQFFAGDYQLMTNNNPSIDPDDHQALWSNVCTINGFQCLTVRTATLKETNGDEYIFTVEFNNADGSLFVLGPCCGATETEMPPVSRFEYRVQKMPDGRFVVLDLPVYVP